MKAVARDVDEYFADLAPEARTTLDALRKTIRAAAPDATEVISYQMPTFKHHGPLVSFAAWKHHCGFYVMSQAIVGAHEGALAPYLTPGDRNTIRFPLGKAPPAGIVTKLVKARMKENEARRKK